MYPSPEVSIYGMAKWLIKDSEKVLCQGHSAQAGIVLWDATYMLSQLFICFAVSSLTRKCN